MTRVIVRDLAVERVLGSDEQTNVTGGGHHHHGHGHHHGGGHGHGHHHGHGNYGQYGFGFYNPWYHNTSHYDWVPGQYIWHNGHLDYVPGHYDYHQTGHFHY